VKKSSKLAALSPFMDEDGLLRVGGRLERAEISFDAKHLIIIPSKHHIVGPLIHHYHKREGHSGARAVLAAIQKDLWIIQGRSRIRYIINRCVICRKKYSAPCEQIMAALPAPRVTAFERPFASTGVDYFGPFLVKQGRSQVKRYGCVFTCLAMRAIHVEVAHSLDAESFLCAFSRFTARRGLPKAIYSDNGSNFVAGSRILKDEFEKMKRDEAQTKIQNSLRAKEVTWHFNPPLASHCGGVWERMIRSIRRVLTAVMNEQVVDDEAFQTFLIEVERILNDRPLLRNTNQIDDLDPLTPSKLLLLHSNSCLPPGVFVDRDRYNRRWRQAQLLANTFWKRWIREYLPTLQRRQKWLKPRRNLSVKDLVLMVDKDFPRGRWPMAVVEEVFPDNRGIVRHVTVRTASGKFKRDVCKLCLLEGSDEEANYTS
jgi:transposase InsO family protein